jgi:hypothetical protein
MLCGLVGVEASAMQQSGCSLRSAWLFSCLSYSSSPEDGGSTFLRNVIQLVQDYKKQ